MTAPDAAEVLKSEIDMLLNERKTLRAELAKLRKRAYGPKPKTAVTVTERPIHPHCRLCGHYPCGCGLEAYQ